MAKRKGFDVIADAQERANHNFHRSYWFNRVTSFTMAEWKANKYFAPIFFVGYTIAGVLWLNSLKNGFDSGKTLWSFLFDFSDSSTTARFVGILLFSAYWVILAIATVQVIVQRIHASPSTSLPERRKEKKKKYPRRPKNYK